MAMLVFFAVLSAVLAVFFFSSMPKGVKVVPRNIQNVLYAPYITEKDGHQFISVSKRKKDYDAAKEILSVLDVMVQLTMSNIMQYDNQTYRRQSVVIEDGKLTGIETSDDYRLKYEPENPEAILSGPEKGYVKYPDIHIPFETVDLKMELEDIDVFQAALRLVEPGLILPDYKAERELLEKLLVGQLGIEHVINSNEMQDKELEVGNLENYFFSESEDYYLINEALKYPKIESAHAVREEHISREYDGIKTDQNKLKVSYKGSDISVTIICDYNNSRANDYLFYVNDNVLATKGLYEIGKAMDSLKDKEFSLNAQKIKVKSAEDQDKKTRYIFLDEISEKYEWVTDVYDGFYIIMETEEVDGAFDEYYEKVKDAISYW
ncbi:MAG: hypothetical protein J6S91_08520 [Treponema sp.]|nr:hypothetical protein [Treponema sp.]